MGIGNNVMVPRRREYKCDGQGRVVDESCYPRLAPDGVIIGSKIILGYSESINTFRGADESKDL
jgi:hypothetical protein